MTSTLLLTASFAAGLIPATILFIGYGFRTPWYESSDGRVLFALFAMFEITYGLSLVTLIWPDIFRDTAAGIAWRVGIRLAVAGVLWAMVFIFFRAQRRGRR